MTNEITMAPWRWGNPTEQMVHYLVYDKTEGWVVSMYLEGVGWFARGVTPYVDPSEDDLLHRVTHRSSEKMLRDGACIMSDEMNPRIWVGKEFMGTNWIWTGVWERFTHYCMYTGNIFVPGNCPEPTIDPSKMKTLETIDKVD